MILGQYRSYHKLHILSTDPTLEKCVTAIVVGFHELPAGCGLQKNFLVNDSASDMWRDVISNYSTEGQTIMILRDTADPGTCTCTNFI